MNKQQGIRRVLYFFILLAGAIYLNYSSFKPNKKNNQDNETFRSLPIVYTSHAKCRMNCRFIDEQEVEYILNSGKINMTKSDIEDLPCPTYALEGKTLDNQDVRIIFADCNEEVKVITAIDLGENHPCDCK